jgi:hypothetical protein
MVFLAGTALAQTAQAGRGDESSPQPVRLSALMSLQARNSDEQSLGVLEKWCIDTEGKPHTSCGGGSMGAVQRRVMLIVIVALSIWAVEPVVREGRLPNIGRLIDAGHVDWNCVSVLPSVTPAATASVCTGEYPGEHSIIDAYYTTERRTAFTVLARTGRSSSTGDLTVDLARGIEGKGV